MPQITKNETERSSGPKSYRMINVFKKTQNKNEKVPSEDGLESVVRLAMTENLNARRLL